MPETVVVGIGYPERRPRGVLMTDVTARILERYGQLVWVFGDASDPKIPDELVMPAAAMWVEEELWSAEHPRELWKAIQDLRRALQTVMSALDYPPDVRWERDLETILRPIEDDERDPRAAEHALAAVEGRDLCACLLERLVESPSRLGGHGFFFAGICQLPMADGHFPDIDRGNDGDWRLLLAAQLAKGVGVPRQREWAPGPNEIAAAIANAANGKHDDGSGLAVRKRVSRARTKLSASIGKETAEQILLPARLLERYRAQADSYEASLATNKIR